MRQIQQQLKTSRYTVKNGIANSSSTSKIPAPELALTGERKSLLSLIQPKKCASRAISPAPLQSSTAANAATAGARIKGNSNSRPDSAPRKKRWPLRVIASAAAVDNNTVSKAMVRLNKKLSATSRLCKMVCQWMLVKPLLKTGESCIPGPAPSAPVRAVRRDPAHAHAAAALKIDLAKPWAGD